MPKGTCTLSDSWLKKDEYKLWLARTSSSQYALCTLLRKRSQIDLWYGVECALLKHAGGQVHGKRVKEAESANKYLSALYLMAQYLKGLYHLNNTFAK